MVKSRRDCFLRLKKQVGKLFGKLFPYCQSRRRIYVLTVGLEPSLLHCEHLSVFATGFFYLLQVVFSLGLPGIHLNIFVI